jgi:hypothetical protein
MNGENVKMNNSTMYIVFFYNLPIVFIAYGSQNTFFQETKHNYGVQ